MLIFFVYGIPAPCLSASFVLCCKWSKVERRSRGCFLSPARRPHRVRRQGLRERYLCTLRTPRTTTRLCLGFLGAGSSCRRNKTTSSFCSLSIKKPAVSDGCCVRCAPLSCPCLTHLSLFHCRAVAGAGLLFFLFPSGVGGEMRSTLRREREIGNKENSVLGTSLPFHAIILSRLKGN